MQSIPEKKARSGTWKLCGFPWKPNPNRRSLRITTRIVEGEEKDSEDEEEDPDKAPDDMGEEYEVKIDEEEDAERQREEIKKAKEAEEFEKRQAKDRWHPKTFQMYIRKEDVWKYGETEKCGGCKYVIGERKNAEGHSRACKERMKEAMRNDIDDSHRVEKDKEKQEKKQEEQE